MLKYYSILIGENPRYTALFQPASKRKIALYANCLMIPVILWFINSYLLVSHVLQSNIWVALLTGVIAAFIIFLIERAIIMSNGSRPIFWFRIVLGFIVASLGSISFDEVIFKNDIDNKIAQYKNAETDSAVHKVETEYQNQIKAQELIVDQKAVDWKKSLQDVKDEADGTGGSRQKLVGKIALLKMNIAEKQEADYNSENYKLVTLKSDLDSSKALAKAKAEADFNGNGLLLRIRAMFDLLGEDGFMLAIYILFTAFLFCLEFLVVLIKIGSKNSVDEDIEKARDTLLREKTNKILERKAILFEPEQFLPTVKAAKAVLVQRNTSVL
ncbi:MAG: DUF4407 domain-containing protein [Sphingobacteriales bacterium]|nr:DUF4407 domain-containing protein [Sphingobacteriales bacterium]